MSLVTRFSVFSHCNDLGGKVWNPAIKWTKKYAVFVVLETDQGCSGLGECWCFDTAPDTLVAFLRTEIAPQFLGTPVADIKSVCERLVIAATLTARHGILASALSGVDIAAHDLQSREANLPLWRFLRVQAGNDTQAAGSVYLYASGGLYGQDKTTHDLVAEMCAMQASGYNLVKMKVGALSLQQDIERVLAVLDALPLTCKLIIDGVYRYSYHQALTVFSALPADRIEAFQSPLAVQDVAGMRSLCKEGVPVMSAEAEYRQEVHCQLLAMSAVKYLQVAPIACGGISRLQELHNRMELKTEPTSAMSLEVSSTAVAFMAACHFAAAPINQVSALHCLAPR